MNNRQAINKLILELLIEANELMPDQRLGQLLINCGVSSGDNLFYEESYETLKRVNVAIERLLDANSQEK